jgi:hypothetical protein
MNAAPDRGDGVFFRNSRIRLRDIEDGAFTILLGERAGANQPADWAGVFSTVTGAGQMPSSDRTRVLGHTGPVTQQQTSTVATHEGQQNEVAIVHHEARMWIASRPLASPCPADFGGPHATISHFLFVNGSVRPVSASVNREVYSGLATRAGGEPISGTDF